MTSLSIDPISGQSQSDSPTPSVSIPTAEWEDIKRRLDSFDRMGASFNQPQASPPPSGPSFSDQLSEIDTQLESLNERIDSAVSSGEPVSRLLSERDKLTSRRTRLQIKHEDIDPALSSGLSSIEHLTSEITRSKMKHYDIVKGEVEKALSSLPPEQRINPQIRQAAYNMAVGNNLDKIIAAEKEASLRAEHLSTSPTPSSKSSRSSSSTSSDTPSPRDILSSAALSAIKAKGISVDEYYKKLGYKEGWSEFYTKRGKAYFNSDSDN